jgi:hypothetical protein
LLIIKKYIEIKIFTKPTINKNVKINFNSILFNILNVVLSLLLFLFYLLNITYIVSIFNYLFLIIIS